MPKKIGNIIHFFPKIKVAVVKLSSGDLKLGDKVNLTAKEGKNFEQTVTSMQIEHANIEIAQKGDEFGLAVKKEVLVPSSLEKV